MGARTARKAAAETAVIQAQIDFAKTIQDSQAAFQDLCNDSWNTISTVRFDARQNLVTDGLDKVMDLIPNQAGKVLFGEQIDVFDRAHALQQRKDVSGHGAAEGSLRLNCQQLAAAVAPGGNANDIFDLSKCNKEKVGQLMIQVHDMLFGALKEAGCGSTEQMRENLIIQFEDLIQFYTWTRDLTQLYSLTWNTATRPQSQKSVRSAQPAEIDMAITR